jgi:nucleoside 2-deoxyribosyltransferase
MNAIAEALEAVGMTTFVPHRDGVEPYVMRFGNVPAPAAVRERVDYAIFALDVYELYERCDAIVCNLNGRVPDEGMIVEASLAFATGKPLVLYKNDVRSAFGGYDNAMLTSLVRGEVVHSLRELPAAVDAARSEATPVTGLVPNMQKAVDYGRRISSVLTALPKELGKRPWSEEVVEHVLRESRR